jgi:RNA polymerase sigma-70 factor (ECF subfamily)
LSELFDDIELVEKLQKGDINAFDLIYEKYSGKLYAFGLKYLRSTEEAEELVQSVFLKLWENHKILKKESSFKSFIFTIAYNDICKLFRKRKYGKEYVKEILYEGTQTYSQYEEGIDYKSVLTQVQKIIDLLPEKQRTIFLKSKFEGKSTKEISAEIGLLPGTIDNSISKSLKFIRNRLSKENFAVALFISLFF